MMDELSRVVAGQTSLALDKGSCAYEVHTFGVDGGDGHGGANVPAGLCSTGGPLSKGKWLAAAVKQARRQASRPAAVVRRLAVSYGTGGGAHFGEPTGFSGSGGLGGKNVEDPDGVGAHCTVNDAGTEECVGSNPVSPTPTSGAEAKSGLGPFSSSPYSRTSWK